MSTLVVGASGVLGGKVATLLLDRGHEVRALSRDPAKLEHLRSRGAHVVRGDLRDPASLHAACSGARIVFTTAAAFDGKGRNSPAEVDGRGNRNLIDAARAAGVEQFVFTSAMVAKADSPVDFFRLKHETEQYLRASGVPWTMLRPGAFMDVWGVTIGGAIASNGSATILGSGANPINFVAVDDVAEAAARVLGEPAAFRNVSLDVGGPENLTMEQVAQLFERVLGRTARRKKAPLAVMRALGLLLAPVAPVTSRMMKAGVELDTTDQRMERTRLPNGDLLQATRMEDWVRARYLA